MTPNTDLPADLNRIGPIRNHISGVSNVLRKYAQVVAVACLFGCKTDGPVEYGFLRVQAVTAGVDIDDGYRLDINTRTGPQDDGVFGPNDTTLFSTSAGDVRVALGEIDPNCIVSGANPRTVRVAANDTASTTFELSCVAMGAYIGIHIGSAGVDRDVDAYQVAFDGVISRYVHLIDSLVFRKVPAGTHVVALRDVAANCAVSIDTLQTATLAVGDTLRLQWDVTCVEATNRRLLFSGLMLPDTAPDIYVRSPHDTLPMNLTHTAGTDELPVWSPDGQRIAFVSNRTGRDEVYVMNSDGTVLVQLTSVAGGNSFPAWSPDGTRIAFISGRGGRSALYVMNVDGTGQTRFTTDTAVESFPTWSPDGARIAYLRGCLACIPSTAEVYVATGSDTTRLTTQAKAYSWPVWSPDGAHIAFSSRDSLVIMDADGTHTIRLAGWSPMGAGASPTWSPDGRQLAFVYNAAVHRVSFDGTGARLLAGGWDPAWSSDGTIAFVQSSGCLSLGCSLHRELTVMKSDGTKAVRLTSGGWTVRPAWSP